MRNGGKQVVSAALAIALGVGGTLPRLADAAVVKVPAGTPISVRLLDDLSSKTAQTGQRVRYEVISDVKVKGAVVINAGATAMGEVQYAQDAGMVGTAGQLRVILQTAEAVDGTPVVISAGKGSEGKDKMAQSVGIGVICCFLALLMKGKEAEMKAGTILTGMVSVPVEVTVP